MMGMSRKYLAEIGVLALVGAGAFMVLAAYDAWEWFYDLTRVYERIELDEALLVVPIILVLMAVFAARRVGELSVAARRLERANSDLERARGRIEALQRTKEEFLSYAGHELKNPLGGVISALQLLEIARGKEDIDRAVGMALDAARALRASAMGIVDVTRLLMEYRQEAPSLFCPADMLRDATATVRAQARAKGLEFELDVADEVPGAVLGHGELLLHVVQNLAENAVKYTRSGSVRVDCSADGRAGGGLRVTVSDTGPGIPPELADALFEPYRRGGDLRVIERGAGLGLTIAKRLVEVLGGSITVGGGEGDGAVFTVTVPVESAAAVAPDGPGGRSV